MEKNPKVTIVIPVYNGENFLKEAIDSALAQTYSNLEILVVNDGSKDETENICLSYGDKIRYIGQENKGVSSALNMAIKNMKGEYFSWLSHDDIYYPNKIETQINFINKQKKKNIILYCDYACINADGKDYSKPFILNHQELTKKPEYSLLRGAINGITLLIPRKAFDDCGFFNLNLRCTQDYDMWLRMMKKDYKFVHMNVIITKTRIHSLQDTQKNSKVITEGINLWYNLIESINDKRKVELEGSIYNYYYEMAKFLSTTPYRENFDYCIKKCREKDFAKYQSQPISYFSGSSKLKKIKYYLKNQGLVNTSKIIFNRLFRKN